MLAPGSVPTSLLCVGRADAQYQANWVRIGNTDFASDEFFAAKDSWRAVSRLQVLQRISLHVGYVRGRTVSNASPPPGYHNGRASPFSFTRTKAGSPCKWVDTRRALPSADHFKLSAL